MYKKFLILLCALSIIMGCQGTQTKKTNTESKPKNTINTDKEKDLLKTDILNQTTEKVVYDTITTVDQIHLKPFLEAYGKENPEMRAVIKTQFGDIEILLFGDTPWHRANFVRLVKLGYFQTTYFYRVSKGFVIQAGNSDNKITSRMRNAIGSYLIPQEFSKNHLNYYGAVGAAKFSEQNVSKASSPFEFYIVMDKNGAHHLDFEHTVFGRVTKGMEVAEKIGMVKTDPNSEWPVDNVQLEIELLD